MEGEVRIFSEGGLTSNTTYNVFIFGDDIVDMSGRVFQSVARGTDARTVVYTDFSYFVEEFTDENASTQHLCSDDLFPGAQRISHSRFRLRRNTGGSTLMAIKCRLILFQISGCHATRLGLILGLERSSSLHRWNRS